jgi:predicted dehydrogenase
LDIINWLINCKPKSVFAESRNGLSSEDDFLVVTIKYENGVVATLQNSWCTVPTSSSSSHARFEVYGVDGIAELIDSDMNVQIYRKSNQITQPDTYEHFEMGGVFHGYFRNLIEGVIHRIHASDIDNSQRLEDALQTVIIGDAISKSIREGKKISIDY